MDGSVNEKITFDKESLKRLELLSAKFQTNKKGMELNVKLDIIDGKLHLDHKMNPKYEKNWKSMENILLQMVRLAVEFMVYNFSAYYATEEDYENELKRIHAIMEENTASYLQILVDQGHEPFMIAVLSQTGVCQMQYNLMNLKMKNGRWTRANGDYWNGEGWVNDKGIVYYEVAFDQIAKILVA